MDICLHVRMDTFQLRVKKVILQDTKLRFPNEINMHFHKIKIDEPHTHTWLKADIIYIHFFGNLDT